MKSIFLTTQQVKQVVAYFRQGGGRLDFVEVDFTDTVRIREASTEDEPDGPDAFVAIKKTDYHGPEGYWICRYDPEWVGLEAGA